MPIPTLAEAKRQLAKVGAARAEGPALAASYAPLVVSHCALSAKMTSTIYEHLCTVADITAEVKRLLTDPRAALEVVFP